MEGVGEGIKIKSWNNWEKVRNAGLGPTTPREGMSYSQLIRRSKLASYTPQVDQIYTTSKQNASRSNFGLKSSLRLSSPAPFIRINKLDKLEYRKGTSEVKYVKKWDETPVAITPAEYSVRESALSAFTHQSAYSDTLYDPRKLNPNPPKKETPDGRPDLLDSLFNKVFQPVRSVNYFAMDTTEFDAFLLSLADRTAEFKQFVEAKTQLQRGGKAAPVSLFANAQLSAQELTSLVDQFLVSTHAPSPTEFRPSPGPHSTLALQYSTPTTLESSLAPPLPGRILGSAPATNSYESNSAPFSRTAKALSTLLGQVVEVPFRAQAGGTTTTWFPDDGTPPTRSNVPGRADFKIAPRIDYQGYVERMDRTSRRGRASFADAQSEAGGRNARLRSDLLRDEAQLHLVPTVVTERDRKPLLGSSKYVGTSRSTGKRPDIVLDAGIKRLPMKRDMITQKYSGAERKQRGDQRDALVQARGQQEYRQNKGKSPASLLASLEGLLSTHEK